MLPTPYLAVDLARLRRNVRRTAELAAMRRVALRPHAKTHKTPEIARMQLAAGAVGLTVATVGEAEVFARAGCTDLFVGYPLWVDRDRAARIRDLLDRVTLTIGVESTEGAAAVGRFLGGSPLRVLVEVDSGQHRTGTSPAGAGAVARTATRAGLDVRGVFTFPGHGYARRKARSAAADEATALADAAGSLREAGVEPRVLSGGSTPTLRHSDAEVLTELRPGVYVFNDAQQWELGAARPEDVALTCTATVVARDRGRVVLDAGSKVLGADRASYATGYGRLLDHPDARIVQLAEHHAVVDTVGAVPPPIGARVSVVPNHVCAAVNLADELHAFEGARTLSWRVAARGQNS